ncbi:exp1-like protein [Linnemannia exigua]|uniref:Exp1-like protein n=1 Tax=Linnemannia exigua TaxID=604196 RepID=A0AAD4H713_9FUNG|nr:exp1-like protein [Linnemannia exigua]
MFSLSAFRSVLAISATQPMRAMSVKAAAASATTKTRIKKETTSTTKAAAPAKGTKNKAKKEVAPKPKAKKVAPVKPKKVEAISMPKRPSTAWGLFFVEHLDKVRASGKAIIPTAETTVASAQWKQLSEAQKQVYKDKYQANLAEFKKNTSKRLEELTPEEFRIENARRQALRAAGKRGLPSLKDPNAPKRPLSSFFRYAQDQRDAGKVSSLPIKDQAKALAESWKRISEQEKARYVELSREATEAYKVKRAAYLEGNQ